MAQGPHQLGGNGFPPHCCAAPREEAPWVPKIKWSVVPLAGWQVLPVAPALGVMAQSPWFSPSYCLIVKPIKGAVYFCWHLARILGPALLLKDALGAGGPVFQIYLLVAQCIYAQGHLLYHPLLVEHPLTCLY